MLTYRALPGVCQFNFAGGRDLVLHVRTLLLTTVLLHLCNQSKNMTGTARILYPQFFKECAPRILRSALVSPLLWSKGSPAFRNVVHVVGSFEKG